MRGACFCPSESVLDHLAPLAELLQVPLVIDEKTIQELINKYYPHVDTHLIENPLALFTYVATHYDTLFYSSSNLYHDLSPVLGEKIRFWFCPHGNSDKPLDLYTGLPHAFIYGPQMARRLQGSFQSLVTTGNYRLEHYLLHQSFYDDLAEEEIFSHLDPSQKICLYAPTWGNEDELLKEMHSLLDTPRENLIIKPHPTSLRFHSPLFDPIRIRCKESVRFLEDFPPIYPLLARTDTLLGNGSSIEYDYLYFKDPNGAEYRDTFGKRKALEEIRIEVITQLASL